MDYSNLTIIRCNEAQAAKAEANTYPDWGKPRGIPSLREFSMLGKALCGPDKDWATDGKFVSWALVARDETGSLNLLAHCDTYRRTSLVRRPGGEVQEAVSYNIASVYTPEEQRGNGYARHLLRLLHYVLAPKESMPPFPDVWGAPPEAYIGDADFSTLYSDIGATFYEKCTKGDKLPGWIADKGLKRVWRVPPGSSDMASDWKWLGHEEVKALEPAAEKHRRAEFAALALPDRASAAILPSGGWLRFFPWYAAVFNTFAGRDGDAHIRRCAVRFSAKNDSDENAYFVYTVQGLLLDDPPKPEEPITKRLFIHHIQGPVSFEDAMTVARHFGAEEVELWGGFSFWDEDAMPTILTEGSVPALAQYTLGTDEVDWIRSEHCFWA